MTYGGNYEGHHKLYGKVKDVFSTAVPRMFVVNPVGEGDLFQLNPTTKLAPATQKREYETFKTGFTREGEIGILCNYLHEKVRVSVPLSPNEPT